MAVNRLKRNLDSVENEMRETLGKYKCLAIGQFTKFFPVSDEQSYAKLQHRIEALESMAGVSWKNRKDGFITANEYIRPDLQLLDCIWFMLYYLKTRYGDDVDYNRFYSSISPKQNLPLKLVFMTDDDVVYYVAYIAKGMERTVYILNEYLQCVVRDGETGVKTVLILEDQRAAKTIAGIHGIDTMLIGMGKRKETSEEPEIKVLGMRPGKASDDGKNETQES